MTDLIERIENGKGLDLKLDTLIECALFQSNCGSTLRPNYAGTKVVLRDRDGNESTYWPADWTMNRPAAIAALRARETKP